MDHRTEREITLILAVTGATGRLGRLVVEKLKAKVPADTTVWWTTG